MKKELIVKNKQLKLNKIQKVKNMSEKIDKKEKGTLSRKKIIINIILVVIIGFAINIVISFFL